MKTNSNCWARLFGAQTRKAASHCAIAVVLSVVLGVPALSQRLNQRQIPFQRSRTFGLILVTVEAKGRSAVLIVDTASNNTIISSEFADVPPGGLHKAVSTGKGSGFTGTGVFARATLKIGPVTWRDHPIIVMDMHDFSESFGQKIDGLLGMDFFSEFEFVALDLKNHKLIFEPEH